MVSELSTHPAENCKKMISAKAFTPPVTFRMYGMPMVTGRERIGDVQDERLFTGCDVDRHKQERLSAMPMSTEREGVGDVQDEMNH